MVGIPPSLSPYISVLHRKIVNNKVEMVFYSSLFDITTVEILSFFFFFFLSLAGNESLFPKHKHILSLFGFGCVSCCSWVTSVVLLAICLPH